MTSDLPIYQQIRNQIILALATGQLKPGESLPSVRQLADDIGVNM
ncbi:GntR family transcriptional regulator, partial [Vagococcus salmoninarum]